MNEFLNLFIYDTLFWFGLFGLLANIFIWCFLFARERRLKRAEDRFRKKAGHIIARADQESLAIIGEASHTASQLLSQTEMVDQNVQEELTKSFHHLLSVNATKLSQELTSLVNSNREVSEAALKELLLQNTQSIQSYIGSLKSQDQALHTSLQEKLNLAYAKALNEVEDYKQAKIAAIDKSLNQLLAQIVEEFFREHLELPNQEKLVFESLERAKKEGVFNTTSMSARG